ncbi:virulence factor SrfB [Enterobacterales bacterium CwR94]|nr:virulence factor SrfB [Enterobacterales bacterium CwR94]
MLPSAPDYPEQLTLIENSGIQFIDFPFSLSAQPDSPFVRRSANGPLLRLEAESGQARWILRTTPDSAPEVVKPELTLAMRQSLALLDKQWLPLPMLRFNGERQLTGGPDNWARMQVVTLPAPDARGHDYRLVLAFDTTLLTQAALAPTLQDVTDGTLFSLAWRNEELTEFLDHTWIDGWLREVFLQRATEIEQRSEAELTRATRMFEHQGHYLNLLQILGFQLAMPALQLVTATDRHPVVPVDVILDVGNSHTCGILVEEHPGDSDGLKHVSELQLRDLSAPHCVWNDLFDSRLAFAETRFGKAHLSRESGRQQAFVWPSCVRVGHEAGRLARQRSGIQGATGLSSPRRYLWDESPFAPGWRFSHATHESAAIAAPLMMLLNDDGEVLSDLPADARLPVFNAQYSRSSLMTLMLTELLSQSLMQINSVAQRLRMSHSQAPRQIRNIILTLPSAMPKPEREIFRRRMHEAITLVWQAQGWSAHRYPHPQVQMEWDEATCGQMVWLYNEIQVNFAGSTEAFFASQARPDKPLDEADSLTVASIDIGGGTTDLAITRYQLEAGSGTQRHVHPRLLFREGFKVAGDDILLDVIQLCVLPALEQALQQQGLTDSAALMRRLFGASDLADGLSVMRQQTTLQLFIPLGQHLLSAYENWDPLDLLSEVDTTFGEALATPLTHTLLEHLETEIARALPEGHAPFRLLSTPLIIKLNQLHAEFLSPRMQITQSLRSLCEVVALYECDVLLLTGRPSCFPGIQALFRLMQPLPVNRMVSLEGYHTSDWYPFSTQGRIDDPKSTAAVGAMICLLAMELRLGNFWFNAGDFQPYSTLRYLGRLDAEGVLQDQDISYHDIDLDAPQWQPDSQGHIVVHGNLCLGFRQLDNDRWPATPLYTLTIVDAKLARRVASESALYVKLKAVMPAGANSAESFAIESVRFGDGTPVEAEKLQLKMNTLLTSHQGDSHYWIDSGSLYKK